MKRTSWRRGPLLALLLQLTLGCGSKATSGATLSSAPAVEGSSPAPVISEPAVVDDLPQTVKDPREPTLAAAMDRLLTEEHLLQKHFDDAASREAFPKYLEELDGAKLFLVKADVDALRQYEGRMDDEILEGDLVLARKGAALIARRREAVAKMVAELLSQPLDLTQKEQLETDAKKRDWCASEPELKMRWRKVLKLQVLERVEQLNQIADAQANPKTKPGEDPPKPIKVPPTFEGREEMARKELATRMESRFTRMKDAAALEPSELFFSAVTAVYDPHTQYMPPSEKENFDIQLTGTLEGIGAALGEQDHYIVVSELITGGAAWQQGKLEAGDLILAVAQDGKDPVDVTDMPIDKVVGMIRGPKGTIVTLTVKKADGRMESIAIKRDVVQIEATYARGAILKPHGTSDTIGYVYLPGFYGDIRNSKAGERNATDDVRALIEELKKRKVKGIILDLRGNGGGLLAHARDIAGLFIDKGPVVQVRGSDADVEVLKDEDPGAMYQDNVVVLVDRFSASASEILSGALQDYERAVIVGTGPTHGKGTVQAVIELDRLKKTQGGPSLGVLKLTIQQYFRVTGSSVQNRGVEPDVVMPDPADYLDSRERSLFHAIPWNKVEAAKFSKVPHRWDAKALSAASLARQAKEPVFGRVAQLVKTIKANREDTLVDLDRTTFFETRKKEKAALEAVDLKLADSKPRLDVEPITTAKDKDKAANDKKVQKRIDKWRNDLERDPWLEEGIHVLTDMNAAK